MSGENVNITILERLLNVIAPYPCLGCGFLGPVLCDRCVINITDDMYFACWSCYQPSFSGVCENHMDNNVEAFWVAGWRESVLKEAIDTYKFKNVRRLSYQLAQIINARLPILPPSTLIVPLPTKSLSVRVRGYDHTLLVSKALAGIRGLELSEALRLSGKSKIQHFSDKKDRQEQIKGVFSIDHTKLDKSRPHLVVDDIVTTGATLFEAHKTLVGAGVETVWLSALARQPID